MLPRQRLHLILDPDVALPAAQRFRALQLALILVGIGCTLVDSIPGIDHRLQMGVELAIAVVGLAFAFEYALRLWCAPDLPRLAWLRPNAARWRWALSPAGIIDMLAILPVTGALTWGMILPPDFAAVMVLLFMLKLSAHTPGARLIGRVLYNERRTLLVVLIMFGVVLMAAATLAHIAERTQQPEVFGSIPQALWWAVATLTTTGYGDVVPVTAFGRIVAGFVMISGIGVLALLAGILATGFSEEVKRRDFLRIWELVARVPLFAGIGAQAIADVVARLRARYYPAGAVVVRRGAPGDSMFFIATGEVEVRLSPESIVLSEGMFFGEMALLDRRPRSADIVTLTPCTMLILNMPDFFQLAGQHPALAQAIADEAEKRRGSG